MIFVILRKITKRLNEIKK